MAINRYHTPAKFQYQPLPWDTILKAAASRQNQLDTARAAVAESEFNIDPIKEHAVFAKNLLDQYQSEANRISAELESTHNVAKATRESARLNQRWVNDQMRLGIARSREAQKLYDTKTPGGLEAWQNPRLSFTGQQDPTKGYDASNFAELSYQPHIPTRDFEKKGRDMMKIEETELPGGGFGFQYKDKFDNLIYMKTDKEGITPDMIRDMAKAQTGSFAETPEGRNYIMKTMHENPSYTAQDLQQHIEDFLYERGIGQQTLNISQTPYIRDVGDGLSNPFGASAIIGDVGRSYGVYGGLGKEDLSRKIDQLNKGDYRDQYQAKILETKMQDAIAKFEGLDSTKKLKDKFASQKESYDYKLAHLPDTYSSIEGKNISVRDILTNKNNTYRIDDPEFGDITIRKIDGVKKVDDPLNPGMKREIPRYKPVKVLKGKMADEVRSILKLESQIEEQVTKYNELQDEWLKAGETYSTGRIALSAFGDKEQKAINKFVNRSIDDKNYDMVVTSNNKGTELGDIRLDVDAQLNLWKEFETAKTMGKVKFESIQHKQKEKPSIVLSWTMGSGDEAITRKVEVEPNDINIGDMDNSWQSILSVMKGIRNQSEKSKTIMNKIAESSKLSEVYPIKDSQFNMIDNIKDTGIQPNHEFVNLVDAEGDDSKEGEFNLMIGNTDPVTNQLNKTVITNEQYLNILKTYDSPSAATLKEIKETEAAIAKDGANVPHKFTSTSIALNLIRKPDAQ